MADYTYKGDNVFTNCEPFREGEKITTNYYLNGENVTEKYQGYSSQYSSFASVEEISGYTNNGQKLQFVRKGTFPIFSGANCLYGTSDSGTHVIYRDGDIIYVDGIVNLNNIINGELEPTNEKYIKPTKLGILFCGAGGGGGGWAKYDPDKNAKSSDIYYVAGSGGSGGGICYGILDFTNEDTAYLIKNGIGGQGAVNDETKRTHNGFKSGNKGHSGTYTYLYKISKTAAKGIAARNDVNLGASSFSGVLSNIINTIAVYYGVASAAKNNILLAYAEGGKGGNGGTNGDGAASVAGGAVKNNNYSYFYLCGSHNGGASCGVVDPKNASNEGLDIEVKTQNSFISSVAISHHAIGIKGLDPEKELKEQNIRNCKVPGGHSIGLATVSATSANITSDKVMASKDSLINNNTTFTGITPTSSTDYMGAGGYAGKAGETQFYYQIKSGSSTYTRKVNSNENSSSGDGKSTFADYGFNGGFKLYY